MDYGTAGSIFTVVVFISFIGIVFWTFNKKSKAGFEEAANLVFDDEEKQRDTQKDHESSINE